MKPRLTTIAIAALALTGGALAQIEPLTCHGPGATHDCRTSLGPLDALAAAHATSRDPISAAEQLLERGDAQEARAELLRAVTSAPAGQRARLYFLLGVSESRLGNHEAAATAFASVQPPTFASRYNQALARAHHDYYEAAQWMLEVLLADTLKANHGVTTLEDLPEGDELAPETLAAVDLILTTAATLHYMNETPLDAVTTLEQLLKVTPRTPDLAYLHATASIDLLPGDNAVLHAQRRPDDGARDLLLGRAYAKAGMSEYAERHYRAATQQAITTGDAPALTEVAAYHATNDEWPQAGRAATEALRHDPTNHQARTLLALALERQDQHAQAATEYQRALEHGADPVTTNARRALALAAATDHQAAISAAEAALEAADAHPINSDTSGSMSEEAHYALLTLLATAHHALGENPEALAYAEAATNSPLAQADTHAYAGDLNMQAGNPSAALEHYANADQADPNVARATYHAHLQLEQYELARQALTNLKGETGETLHLIAWTYALQGETRAAHQAWQRAAQADYAPAKQLLERIR